MDEREAILRLQGGDISGLAWLVNAHQLEAIRVATLITRDRELAEDIVQAAFLRAYDRIASFDPERPFRPYFLRSVMNDATKAVTRRWRSLPWHREGHELHPDPDHTPEAAVIAAETNAAVHAALAAMPASQRRLLVQRYFLGWTDQEMASAANCPPGTIKSRLHAARRRIKQFLWMYRPSQEPPN
jgi:RNA polymerase sigma-70 factor, ECF subfamily